MASVAEAAVAKGKVIAVRDGLVVFNPAGTSYELQLVTAQAYRGPVQKPVRCTISAKARKVYTVPSGGSYITPIFGPPRIVQGLVRSASRESLVVQAGVPLQIELPAAEHAIDLDEGQIAVGRMVNVVCEPGVRVEFV